MPGSGHSLPSTTKAPARLPACEGLLKPGSYCWSLPPGGGKVGIGG